MEYGQYVQICQIEYKLQYVLYSTCIHTTHYIFICGGIKQEGYIF